MHCKGIKSLPWKPVTASIDVAIQVIKDLMLRYGSVLLQAAHRSLSLSLHGSHLTLCDREPHHLRQQFWSQHLGDRDSSDSYSLCKVCTPFSRYELSGVSLPSPSLHLLEGTGRKEWRSGAGKGMSHTLTSGNKKFAGNVTS